ncbi:hypothetical protein B0H14DRAFT_3525801 [Mycena olivaceomarginata]|nr:hypothetical protein B0H14DRAFT_3525801 [Mycena olivaceomarginata]
MADVQMPIESDELPTLTRTQKRQLTIARAEKKARQEQKAFEAETKAAGGGRQAKRNAKANAVWNVDNPSSRKRTSSTVEVSEKTKKPRKSAATVDADVHEPTKTM